MCFIWVFHHSFVSSDLPLDFYSHPSILLICWPINAETLDLM